MEILNENKICIYTQSYRKKEKKLVKYVPQLTKFPIGNTPSPFTTKHTVNISDVYIHIPNDYQQGVHSRKSLSKIHFQAIPLQEYVGVTVHLKHLIYIIFAFLSESIGFFCHVLLGYVLI